MTLGTNLAARHQAFHDLHQQGCFVIPNPWDRGSARMMAALGAKALATSSAAHAFTLGRPDLGGVTRDEALAHAADLIGATPLPVSGDFENGFVTAPMMWLKPCGCRARSDCRASASRIRR
jgi:2-methylisocitrate lyase-like PEP mutase family enzyme